MLAVLTGEDIAKRGLGTLRPFAPRKRSDGQPMFVCAQPLLAKDRVRYVGDPVAFVVAETVEQAKDAAELIEVDYEALPAVITAEEALAPGAPAVHDENPSNEAFLQEGGNKEAVDAAFATAAHLIKHKVIINRITANTMEPRGCIGSYDPVEERYTIRCTTQSMQGTKAALAGQIFKVPHNKVRVICDNMGGGFGMKGGVNQEFGLSLFAAEVIGRPVRWTAERSEGVMTDEMSRGSHVDVDPGARQGWQVPGAARRSTTDRWALITRRIVRERHSPRARLLRQHLCFPGGARAGESGADQHHDDRALSRRRPARADHRHRDDHR